MTFQNWFVGAVIVTLAIENIRGYLKSICYYFKKMDLVLAQEVGPIG